MPPEVTNEGALEAINAALNGEDPPETVTPEPETPEGDAPEGGTPEGDAPDADGEEGEALEGEEAEKAEAEGRERNPDGTFKKAAPKDEAKPEDKKPEGEKKTEAKKPDPVNDPIPKDLIPATQERMRTLARMVKEKDAEVTQAREDLDVIVKGFQSAGVSPQQYTETLSFLALFNSGDPTQQAKALELVEGVAERLATLLGKERSVTDPLAAHADLQDAVRKGQVTAQYAKEIARTRNAEQFRGSIDQSARQQQQAQAESAQAVATARAELTALEQSLQATDPQYEAKKALLVPALQPVFQAIHPSQWKAKFQEAYRNVHLPAAPKPAASRGAPANQPMRAGKQPAGGQTREAGSMLEAMNAALAGMK